MKKILFVYFTICLLAASGSVTAKAQNKTEMKIRAAAFRYVIAFDFNTEKSGESEKRLVILMEKESFTDDNLRELCNLLNKRFPKLDYLSVAIFTNIADIPTPEERETGKYIPLRMSIPYANLFRSKDVTRIEVVKDSKRYNIEITYD